MEKQFRLLKLLCTRCTRINQEQIMGVASYVSPVSPPPFAAQFAEVTVDTETGTGHGGQTRHGC
jgi:CO/xanthine dehydrogenase Mo-binding subunit